ncbi:23S rRNA (pseudouridine(1915)-N(3))-methyltransferase RlmH [Pelagibacteraceae bacterium]|jgi:23S rRNA (pseudouridine1915-N3)-methyltransferase|nr:23S rRNA (pseudouridine(1915)-N(3))-methyltransferase RlmH [Pelagibacteraceae bacterium]MDA7763310.1 23S rRNA (pseudouridine(1915)-N(3))-methyltransferase RlmH [Pelagibacteraceae bacterium]MDC0426271.1 23S rRNA (pseudouridine(1915)-N(3))-methyltransferase RlmH [Pelagibacteraceae bacterium]MDC1538530.1 23S rRNA (pseudouridine(1915)-N(3))-methyltransferase RlmH [Pelagibacteraceae bacterium]
MKVTILCEGRINKGPEKELCTLYQQRINSIKQSGFSNFLIKQSTSKEIIKIINNKNSNTKILILSEIGKIYSSIEFSKYIQKTLNNGIKELYLLIGKPEGISVSTGKCEKISLGKMTFPHSLSRVILCEQFYRCATIITNHPYHKY